MPPSIEVTTAVEATLTNKTWSSPTRLKLFSNASPPCISCAFTIPINTSFMRRGSLPTDTLRRLMKSATARIEPRLSEGCPHSAASQVSLKSSQRIMQPMSQAAFTGSITNCVPGTRAPFGTIVPGTTGPKCLEHSGNFCAKNPQPSVSIKQFRAVSMASELVTS